MVGGAPLVAVAIALILLGEPLRVPLVVGAIAIVAGGALLAVERDRPGHIRRLGPRVRRRRCGALRDARQPRPRAAHACEPGTAAAATLLSGAFVAALWTRRPPTTRELRTLAPAGLFFGLSYVCLFEAYFRGRVSVVSPLVATESLWGVALAALLIRHTEGMGRRLAIGALLVVVGGARDRRDALAALLGDQEDERERDEGGDHAGEAAADAAGDRDDRDADREVRGMQRRAALPRRHAGCHALVDPAVDLLLDPVEEAVDQLLVVGRAELAPGRDRRLELVPCGLVHLAKVGAEHGGCKGFDDLL